MNEVEVVEGGFPAYDLIEFNGTEFLRGWLRSVVVLHVVSPGWRLIAANPVEPASTPFRDVAHAHTGTDPPSVGQVPLNDTQPPVKSLGPKGLRETAAAKRTGAGAAITYAF
jgi:hypothetical protein